MTKILNEKFYFDLMKDILESKLKKKEKNNSIPHPIHFKHVKGDDKELNESIVSASSWINDSKHSNNNHLGKTHDIISKKLHSANKFTKDRVDHIKNYTDDSGELNKHLIKSKNKPTGDHEKIANNLDNVIDKNRIKHNVHVYSGTSFDPTKHHNKKGILHSPSYISTTHAKHIASNFSHKIHNKHHIIHIKLKKNDPAVHISRKSKHMHEHETVIKRGTNLKHEGTKKYLNDDDEDYDVHVHTYSVHHDK